MNEYQEQAQAFLDKTGTEIKTKFLHYNKHFDSDTEKRDIYQITLTKGNREYSFKFGQSLVCSGKYRVCQTYCPVKTRKTYSIINPIVKNVCKPSSLKCKSSKWVEPCISINDPKEANKLPRTANYLNTEFSEPTPYDVLTALTKNEPGTFQDFCDDFGYSNDSISAKKTYEAVRDEWLNVSRLFNNEEMKLLEEIN